MLVPHPAPKTDENIDTQIDMNHLIYMFIIPIIYYSFFCPWITHDTHVFSHVGYGLNAAGPQAPAQQLLGPGPWSRAHIHYGRQYEHGGQSKANH